MKQLVYSEDAASFFYMEEAVEMLCVASPSPIFIALLLRLSKKTRRRVWQYLIDTEKCATSWCDEFYRQLWQHKALRPTLGVDYRNLHPIFVDVGDRLKNESYSLGKILIKKMHVKCLDVLVSAFFTYCPDTTIAYPGWETVRGLDITEFFDWYFVACALSIRTDKMILFNALRRHDGDPIVPMDATLCII